VRLTLVFSAGFDKLFAPFIVIDSLLSTVSVRPRRVLADLPELPEGFFLSTSSSFSGRLNDLA
jgi:hypothetical protein